jgi:hypothetical protein
MGSPLFLLPCYRPLGCRTNSWHSLRFLYGRRNRESRRLARWTPVVVRTSSLSWSADGEGLHAKCQPHCQSDYVVCGSDVFSRCPNPGGALGMALGRPVEQVVCSGCAGMGGWNVGEQLDEPHGRLFQGPTRPRQSMSDRLHLLWKSGRLERSRWRGGRFACTSLIRRWSLEGLTVARYDDVNMDGDVSSISMSINNWLLTQLLSIQQLPTQSRFKSHSSPRPPQTPAASF